MNDLAWLKDVKINPKAWDEWLSKQPLSTNIEDRRNLDKERLDQVFETIVQQRLNK